MYVNTTYRADKKNSYLKKSGKNYFKNGFGGVLDFTGPER